MCGALKYRNYKNLKVLFNLVIAVSGAFRGRRLSQKSIRDSIGHDLAQWIRSSLALQRPRLTQESLIQEENIDQILSDWAEHATNPPAAI
jgi:hypothetical protein